MYSDKSIVTVFDAADTLTCFPVYFLNYRFIRLNHYWLTEPGRGHGGQAQYTHTRKCVIFQRRLLQKEWLSCRNIQNKPSSLSCMFCSLIRSVLSCDECCSLVVAWVVYAAVCRLNIQPVRPVVCWNWYTWGTNSRQLVNCRDCFAHILWIVIWEVKNFNIPVCEKLITFLWLLPSAKKVLTQLRQVSKINTVIHVYYDLHAVYPNLLQTGFREEKKQTNTKTKRTVLFSTEKRPQGRSRSLAWKCCGIPGRSWKESLEGLGFTPGHFTSVTEPWMDG